MGAERKIQRVILIAYGNRGYEWLAETERALIRFEQLERLIAAQVIQFWAVGADAPVQQGALKTVARDLDPSQMRELLDRGASANLLVSFPSLTLDSVFVLERWSLFAQDTETRVGLRKVLDGARRSDTAQQSLPEFDYQWISLADCTRGAVPPSESAIALARRAIEPDPYPDRVFLIDKVDARNAVITTDLADRAFRAVTVALLTSSAAFPTTEVDQSSVFGVDAPERAILPISILTVRFSSQSLKTIFARRVSRQVFNGTLMPLSMQPSDEVVPLEKLPELEAREIAMGTFSRLSARERRTHSAADLLRVAFASGTRADLQASRVEAARRAQRKAFSRRELETPGLATLPEARPEANGQSGLRKAMSLLLRLLGIKSKEEIRESDTSITNSDLTSGNAIEWETLCNELDIVVATWKAELAKSRADGQTVWGQSEVDPYEWHLLDDPNRSTESDGLSDSELRLFAQAVVDEITIGTNGDAALDRVVGNRAALMIRSGEDLQSLLKSSLGNTNSAPVTNSLKRLPLMVSALKCECLEILWIHDPTVVSEAEVFSVEPASNRTILRSMTHEDPRRIARIAFGNNVQWKDIISLRLLETR